MSKATYPKAHFGSYLRELRLGKGLTGAEVTRAINGRMSSTGKYENGIAHPSPSTLAALMRFLGGDIKQATKRISKDKDDQLARKAKAALNSIPKKEQVFLSEARSRQNAGPDMDQGLGDNEIKRIAFNVDRAIYLINRGREEAKRERSRIAALTEKVNALCKVWGIEESVDPVDQIDNQQTELRQ